jgi:uncharacterized membrane protein SpoIIM required for sporulation
VILDLQSFVAGNQPRWQELEHLLDRLEQGGLAGDLEALERLFRLYERACADLARLSTYAAAPEVQGHLEALVARAHAEVHDTRRQPATLTPWRVLTRSFPRAFRRHLRTFVLAGTITLLGGLFGGLVVVADPAAKPTLLPFDHLLGDPSDRVRTEESSDREALEGPLASFSAMLATHNTRVGILCLALGMTFGVGTVVLLFYNGVVLGAVCIDYIMAGEGLFLAGWLLPHGVVEIPAILIAGQAGLVLARALLAGRRRTSMRQSLRAARSDLVALTSGFAALLVWAALVESFLSQTHQPVLPYPVKIALGLAELVLLVLFLSRAGRT